MSKLSHLNSHGEANMVDVSAKALQTRTAIAESFIHLQPETLAAIDSQSLGKGDVLATARIAGIQAAKQTSNLIPLCHQLPLQKVQVDFAQETTPEATGIRITTLAKHTGQTGVEMEALTAASVAALTLYDMCKAIDKQMRIGETKLLSKEKEAIGKTKP